MDVAQRNREMAAKDAEIERLTEAHKDCDYAIDNNYRAWQEAQAEVASLKARVERLRAYIKVVNPYSMDIVPQRVNLAAVKAFMALEDADLSDPAPDAGQEVG